MPSTYTLNNGIELIGTGEQSGTWGDTTNTNLELLDTALDGQVTITATSAGSFSSPNDLPISDGAVSNGRNRMVIITSATDLGADVYYQLTPNDAEKIIYVRNDLNAQDLILFQGTYNASNDYVVPNGKTAIIFFDGAGTGAVAANVFNNAHFDAMNIVGNVEIGGTSTFNDDVTLTGASYDVVWDKSDNRLEFSDNAQLSFGDAADLRIYHDASHNYIQDAGTGNLYLTTNGNAVVIDDGTNNLAAFNATSGESALYYGSSGKKLATTSTGIDVTGNATFEDDGKAIFGAGSDLQIYHSGSESFIDETGTGNLNIKTNGAGILFLSGTDNLAKFISDGAAELYYDNSLRLSTTTSGVTMQNSNSDLSVFMNSVGSATLTIAADSNNVGETDIATLNLTQDNGLTEMVVGLNGDADQVYTGIAANLGYLGSTLGMQIAVDFQNTPFPVAQFGQSGDITFMTASNDQQFKFDYSSGYVGIGLEGSANPAGVLHVNAPTTVADDGYMVRFSTQGGGALRFHATQYNVSAPTWSLETGSSESLKFKTGGSIGFQPNSSGSDYANFSTTQILFNTDDLEVVGAAPVVKISNTTEDVAKFAIVDSADDGQNFSFGYDAQLEDGIITIDSNEVMRFHGDGNVYLGSEIPNTQTPYYDAGNATQIYPQFGIIGNTAGSKNNQSMAIMDYSTSGNNEPQLVLGHGTSGTIGDNSTALVGANNLGRILFNGSDGTKMANGYFIFAEAAADWTSTTSPTNVMFEVEQDDGSRANMMHSHDGYLGVSDANHWNSGSLPDGILHLYGATPKLYIDNTEETEGGIVFRDGNAGDPNAQAAAIKFDSGNTNALSFYNNDESALRMRIYSSGEVSHPWQSCINVYRTTTVSPAVNGAIIFNTKRLDNNTDYSTSTGKYTVPVDGLYQLNAQVCFDGGNGQDDSMYIYILKNGSTLVSQATINPKYHTVSGVEITYALAGTVSAVAGDYFQVELADIGATGAPNMVGSATYFSGHLI